MSFDYDNLIIKKEHEFRGWDIENYKQCLVCEKLSEKDFCSNDCKSAFLR